VADASDRTLYQELRLALVFNGGVSLAVWMGGVAKEIDRFRCAFHGDDAALAPHRELLDAVRTELVTDIVSGTSAGGINGAMLGYVVANGKSLECAGADTIREMWQRLGALDELLDQDDPQSALSSDDLFRGCADVFARLHAADAKLAPAASRRMRLTITATDSRGYDVSIEPAAVTGRDHRLQFRFRLVERPAGDELCLSPDLLAALAGAAGAGDLGPQAVGAPPSPRDLDGDDAPRLLARAARTTASFPVAFAPSELPRNWSTSPLPDDPTTLTGTPPLAGVVEMRAHGGTADRPDPPPHSSWYAIDGGLWDNSPFSAVLRGIDRTPSDRDVTRVVAYVVATDAPEPTPTSGPAPTLLAAVSNAIALPSNVSFVNDLERMRADLEQEKTREESVAWLLGVEPPDVFAVAALLFPIYRRRRRDELAGQGETGAAPAFAELPDAGAALETWEATPGGWAWDIRPVRVAIREARRLLRLVLGSLAARPGEHRETVERLVLARRLLSQLAWVIDDLSDHRADADPAALARVCGQAMHDFAAAVAGLHDDIAALPPGSASAEAARQSAVALTAGGPDMVVKRALAVEVALHALTTDERPHKVDYRLATIRPDHVWPLPGSDAGAGPAKERPPLMGASLHHFGGFLRGSWRLSDWMWGRLDGSARLVALLLDERQVDRLTAGDAGERGALAGRLAAVAIPGPGAGPFERARELAHEAYRVRGLPEAAGEGPASAAALDAPPERHAALVDGWRDSLTERYATELAAKDLDLVRADLRRRLQLAVLEDEVPGIVDAIEAEHGPKLSPDDLRRQPDRGLRALAAALDQLQPRRDELMRDGERAAANVLYALDHGFLARIAGAMAAAAGAQRSITDRVRGAWRSIRRRLGWGG
jgi:hypothetical protein